MKNLFTENYKTFLKEVREYLNKWKVREYLNKPKYYIYGLENNIVKMLVLPKEIQRLNAISQDFNDLFADEQVNPQIHMELRGDPNSPKQY